MALAGALGRPPLSYGARAALQALGLPLGLPLGTRGLSGSNQSGPTGSGGAWGRPASPRGLYEILGVTPTATQAQIKTAYYKQSFLYHPDRNAGSEDAARQFTRVNEAYLVLGSVSLRKKYDRGLLSREDLRTAGKPSGKEWGASDGVVTTPPRRTQTFSAGRVPVKPVFDFDAFYRAHYGEQLEREQFLRERRREHQRRKEEAQKKWQLQSLSELGLAVLFVATMVLLFNLK
ncbi:dnaJ homolog subfamily C member 30, mitochondrial [Sceloporus undulatus]|uniref:dnaJ homolog subfamily C member 30, mitochondrial n=1 Tax=Sceloporus undulatus TaxID=8520 RepID=UPI001C4BAAB3|nr:dnaJ homolog subfamily C member 30, mitochondrial [Sceloporus undulatus]